MNLPAALDVAIGLVVLYFLLSTICSFAVELVATLGKWRKQMLRDAIARLLSCPGQPPGAGEQTTSVSERFWAHPLARNLAAPGEMPSYLDPATFAAVVMDLTVPGLAEGTAPATADGLERVMAQAVRHGEAQLRYLRNEILRIHRLRGVSPLADTNNPPPPLAELRAGIEKWYHEAMERLTGQYKRIAQRWLLVLGLIAAIAFNADTIRTVAVLSSNDTLRGAVATYGASLAASTNQFTGTSVDFLTTNELASVTELRTNLVQQLKEVQQLQKIGFPLGWAGGAKVCFAPYQTPDKFDRKSLLGWFGLGVLKIVGLLATALAISLGAPFWFDLLNKLVSLRSSGNRISNREPRAANNKSSLPASAPNSLSVTGAAARSSPAPAPFPPDALGKDLLDASATFNPRKAYWLAEVALLAYSAEAPVRNAVDQWGFELAHFFENVQACQGFLAISKDKKIAVLAFRGTEKKLEDWKTDAEFKLTDSPTKIGQSHEGFTTQLALVYPGLVTELKKRLQPDTLLYLTGHSLGAALATLMAARLAADKTCGVCSVHTFGSPRVGDPAFSRQYELTLGHCTYRIVNAEDIVTRVPPRVVPTTKLEYDHVGQVVFFDTDGRMQLNASFWDRFLNTVINALQDFRTALKAALKDHSMELYVRLTKNQAASKD